MKIALILCVVVLGLFFFFSEKEENKQVIGHDYRELPALPGAAVPDSRSNLAVAPERKENPRPATAAQPDLTAAAAEREGQLLARLEEAPDDSEALLELGILISQEKEAPDQAIPILEKSVRLNSHNGLSLFAAVGAYLDSEQTEKGVTFLNSVLADPKANHAAIHAALADIHAAKNDFKKALPHAEAAVEADPGSAASLSILGGVYAALGDARAKETLEKSVEVYRDITKGNLDSEGAQDAIRSLSALYRKEGNETQADRLLNLTNKKIAE